MLLVEHPTEGYVACNVLSPRRLRGPDDVEEEAAQDYRIVEGEVNGQAVRWLVDNKADCHGLDTRCPDPDDLLNLADYSYASMLHAIRLRHLRREPYTWIGSVLVSVNPCIDLNSFSSGMMQRYLGSRPSTAPHPFAVVNKALEAQAASEAVCNNGVVRGPTAAVLVTGESGAGKTEAVKAMLSFLVARRGARSGRVCDALVGSTQALETFGNARTLQNGNSSRFGRLTEVWLDAATGQAEGAAVVPYMLEASRVTRRAHGELNFHIFYVLAQALRSCQSPESPSSAGFPTVCFKASQLQDACVESDDSKFWGSPQLLPAWNELAELTHAAGLSRSPYLVQTAHVDSTTHRDDRSQADAGHPEFPCNGKLEDVTTSLRAAGLQDEQIFSVMEVVVAVALLGNVPVSFASNSEDESCTATPNMTITRNASSTPRSFADRTYESFMLDPGSGSPSGGSKPSALTVVSQLFAVDESALCEFLATRTTDAPRGEEQLVKPRSTRQALMLRDSIAREVYTALFSWLVRKVSDAARRAGSSQEEDGKRYNCSGLGRRGRRVFAILDIYGFEVCETNGLEQLLINYCNERLQALFNAQMFAAEAQEYEAEGVLKELWEPLLQVRKLPALLLLEGEDSTDRQAVPGLFGVVDDEARFRSFGDAEKSAAQMRSRMDIALRGRCGYKAHISSASRFVVSHFAGDVMYESRCFSETNASAVRQEIFSFLGSATRSPFLRTLLTEATSMPAELGYDDDQISAPTSGSAQAVGGSSCSSVGRRRQLFGRTVIQAFRSELDRLISFLSKEQGTQCHYVRCLKPNSSLQPMVFDGASVLRQCRYSGLLETVQIRQHGFPHRRPLVEFVERYGAVAIATCRDIDLSLELAAKWESDDLPGSIHDMSQSELYTWASDVVAASSWMFNSCSSFSSGGMQNEESGDIFVGRTKVMMRANVFSPLEAATQRTHRKAAMLQALVKRYFGRMNWLFLRELVIRVQAAIRGKLLRKKVAALFKARRIAAIQLQRWYRSHVAPRTCQHLEITPRPLIVPPGKIDISSILACSPECDKENSLQNIAPLSSLAVVPVILGVDALKQWAQQPNVRQKVKEVTNPTELRALEHQQEAKMRFVQGKLDELRDCRATMMREVQERNVSRSSSRSSSPVSSARAPPFAAIAPAAELQVVPADVQMQFLQSQSLAQVSWPPGGFSRSSSTESMPVPDAQFSQRRGSASSQAVGSSSGSSFGRSGSKAALGQATAPSQHGVGLTNRARQVRLSERGSQVHRRASESTAAAAPRAGTQTRPGRQVGPPPRQEWNTCTRRPQPGPVATKTMSRATSPRTRGNSNVSSRAPSPRAPSSRAPSPRAPSPGARASSPPVGGPADSASEARHYGLLEELMARAGRLTDLQSRLLHADLGAATGDWSALEELTSGAILPRSSCGVKVLPPARSQPGSAPGSRCASPTRPPPSARGGPPSASSSRCPSPGRPGAPPPISARGSMKPAATTPSPSRSRPAEVIGSQLGASNRCGLARQPSLVMRNGAMSGPSDRAAGSSASPGPRRPGTASLVQPRTSKPSKSPMRHRNAAVGFAGRAYGGA